MAAFNFPNSPSTNDIHSENGVSFKWNGSMWNRFGPAYTDTANLNVTGIGTIAGNFHVGGVLTYEDVTNVDAVGVVTARSGIHIDDSITHIGDTNTKIRFPAADTITAETGGSERVRINSTGQLLIGSTSAATSNTFLEVKNAAAHTELTIISKNDSGALINLGDTDSYNQGRIKYDNSDNSLTFRTSASDRLRITSAGNIGIGVDVPGLKLHIQDGALSSAPTPNSNCDMVVEGTTNTGIQFLSAGQTQLRFGDAASTAAGAIIYSHSDDNFKLNYSNSGFLSFNNGSGEVARIDSNGDMYARSDSTVYLVLGSSGDATSGGANNSMNWIRGSGTNLQYNCAGGTHSWENSGGQKMQLNGEHLELRGASQCRITLGSQGSIGNSSNWIRGDANNLMFNCADTSGEHIFEVAGTAKAKISPGQGVRAENTCKAWVCYKHDGGVSAIHDSFFVTSVSDEGTGIFSVNFAGDMGTEDAVAYQVGSHNWTPMIVGGVAYTPSYGSQNPWWSMEDDWVRIHLQRIDNQNAVDSEWWNLIAFGDAI